MGGGSPLDELKQRMEQECDYAFLAEFAGNTMKVDARAIEIIKPYSGYIFRLTLPFVDPNNSRPYNSLIRTSINSPCSWIGFCDPSNSKNCLIRSSVDFISSSSTYIEYAYDLTSGLSISKSGKVSYYECDFSAIPLDSGEWWCEYEKLSAFYKFPNPYFWNCYVKFYS